MEHPHPTRSDWGMRSFFCAHRQAMAALFTDIPLKDPAQHFMLRTIQQGCKAGSPLSQRGLARDLRLSPATVTATLRSLEKQGLISRRVDPADQRINRVEITAEGEALAAECQQRMKDLDDAMLSDFSPEEIEQLGRYMIRMSENLSKLHPSRKEEPIHD